MKRLIVFLFGLIFISNSSFSQVKLDIEITEIRNNTGNILLQLFDENEKVVTQKMCPGKDIICSFPIENIKPGKYAVRYFHDENLNDVMDTNLLGKPTEGYGF